MKLRELARISRRSAEENGPVKIHQVANSQTVTEIVNQEPGLTSPKIALRLNPDADKHFFDQVSNILYAKTVKAKTAHIKRIKLGGWWCYYPANYRLSTDTLAPVVVAPKRSKKKVTTKSALLIRKIIADRPGVTAKEITQAFHPDPSDNELRTTSAWLTNMTKAAIPKNRISRTKIDNLWHYYPLNYPLSRGSLTPNRIVENVSIPVATPPQKPSALEELMREYVWVTGTDPAPFKNFIDWYKEKK